MRTDRTFAAPRYIGAIVAAAAVALAAGTAQAIPNQHLNPHPDTPEKIGWQQKPGIPDSVNHVHIKDPNIAAINNVGFGDAGGEWRAFSVWDDRFLRYADADNNLNNDLWDRFGHGYIDPNFRPRYLYAGDVPGAAKPRVDEAMAEWNKRAKEEGEQKRTAPDGSKLKTSVIFEKVVSGAHELVVDFIEGFQEIRDAVAEWIVSAAQLVGFPAGDTPTPPTLAFEATPTSKFAVDEAGWKVSTDGKALGDATKTYQDWTDEFATGWAFDKSPDVLFDDLDFDFLSPGGTEYEGDEAAFLALGIDLKDSWGEVFNAATTIDIYEADFYSVALHEWGHVIGLLHSTDGIMYSLAPFTMNRLSHSIDDDNAFGAAALYSIPVPEPATGLILAVGLAGVGLAGARRRGA